MGTFAENLASLAFQVGPSLPFYLLPTAHGFFFSAERNNASSSSTIADSCSGAVALSFAHSAAESAPMGRGDFLSWSAIGSHARDRAD